MLWQIVKTVKVQLPQPAPTLQVPLRDDMKPASLRLLLQHVGHNIVAGAAFGDLLLDARQCARQANGDRQAFAVG